MEGIKRMGQGLSSGSKQQDKRYHAKTEVQEAPLEHKEGLLYCAVIMHWNRLTREAVKSPLLDGSSPVLCARG